MKHCNHQHFILCGKFIKVFNLCQIGGWKFNSFRSWCHSCILIMLFLSWKLVYPLKSNLSLWTCELDTMELLPSSMTSWRCYSFGAKLKWGHNADLASKGADVTMFSYNTPFFPFRFLQYLSFGLMDLDEINVYTHISVHARYNDTLLFKVFLCKVP